VKIDITFEPERILYEDILTEWTDHVEISTPHVSNSAYSHNGRAPKRPRTKKAAKPLQPAAT